MAPPNNPNVAKVTLVGHRDTREWVNTFHADKGAPIVEADLEPIAQAFYNWWHDTYRTRFANTIILDQIQVRVLDPSDPLALDYTTGLPEGGTYSPGLGGETPEPANVTLALSTRTGLAGRKFRGRFYVPAIAAADKTTDDRVTSPTVTAFSACIQALISAVLTSGLQLAIFHRADNTVTHVITGVVDAIIDSQRRRLPARGR